MRRLAPNELKLLARVNRRAPYRPHKKQRRRARRLAKEGLLETPDQALYWATELGWQVLELEATLGRCAYPPARSVPRKIRFPDGRIVHQTLNVDYSTLELRIRAALESRVSEEKEEEAEKEA